MCWNLRSLQPVRGTECNNAACCAELENAREKKGDLISDTRVFMATRSSHLHSGRSGRTPWKWISSASDLQVSRIWPLA